MAKISILGAGSFGCSLAVMLNQYNHKVNLWSYDQHEVETIIKNGQNKKYLPNIKISNSIKITSDIKLAIKDTEIIIIAVPSSAVNEIALNIKDITLNNQIIVCVSKGLEENTQSLMSDLLEKSLPNNDIVILSGPSHAEELAKGILTAVVASSKNRQAAEFVQDNLSNNILRIYVNDDIIGVQLGAALKNIIALAVGICDGLELGDNSKAALITRGLNEIATLGVLLGAKRETFAGLTGIGDLIVTCTSIHSRNKKAGFLIGQGLSPIEAIETVGMVVEGYTCTKCAYKLSQKINFEMPIITEIYKILYENKNVKKSIETLMSRSKKHEIEKTYLDLK